ncbi:MAG TPA: helix-turn-helix domain-containing protein [Blastocatellia bacterium]|nr:helix-turn-helix domain-containing protein [Blastocatellia bacterium]
MNRRGQAASQAKEPQPRNTETISANQKPDVSDVDATELLPKLFDYFHNNREELARALGVHRSTVDRWFASTSRPNNSTLLRMRRLAQERQIV